ncbi:MAG TPA: adenylyltransferase/cytidyltransferase family protein, partial [Candidatus Woesebacteria bacterium]|nr:adenylyltransferase/cytidyltransferase family protein [Candidatus Woesebacteria bacterium]
CQDGLFGATTQKNHFDSIDKWRSWRDARFDKTTSIRRQAESLLRFAIYLDWIMAIGVTGSCAVDGALDDDDLDLVVITKPHRLWLTRAIILLYAILKGKKKIGDDKKIVQSNAIGDHVSTTKQSSSSEWCFNLWLDQQHLELPLEKRSLYTAYEVVQTQWLVDKENVSSRFLSENKWLTSYLEWEELKDEPRQDSFISDKKKNKIQLPDLFYWPITIGLNWLDRLFGWIATSHLTSITRIPQDNLTNHQAFMHDRSSCNFYLERWQQLYQDLFWHYLPVHLQLSLKSAHQKNIPLGLITGVFDLLHQGHLLFLNKAKEAITRLKGQLIIGVESDARVKQVKGESRPIETAASRITRLISLNLAQAVFVLPQEFDQPAHHQQLLELIKPEVLYVSQDSPHLQEKEKLLSRCHGRVEVVCPRDKRYSTTQKLQQLQVEPHQG